MRELHQLSDVPPHLGTVEWEWGGEGGSSDQNSQGMGTLGQVSSGLCGAREKKESKRTAGF